MVDLASIRRSRFVVTYWEAGTHLAYSLVTQVSHPCPPVAVAILDCTTHWTSRAGVCRALSQWSWDRIDQTITELLQHGLLEAADRPASPVEQAWEGWGGWNPVAGFFHAATRSVPRLDLDASRQRAERLIVERDYPPVLKRYPHGPRVVLPACAADADLVAVLQNRRTWREFGARALSLEEVGTLLGLTFAVERWLEIADDRWVALKTAPSGGARHSIEAYLLAFRTEGLDPGTYHYCPDSHALAKLPPPTPPDLLAEFVPTQPGFHDAAAFVVMTSVFARVQWKYQHPHAFRVVFLDAGHLGQTFALVATALGLAPFGTAALDAPAIEHHLGIDGVAESVVFAVGVGARPAGKAWAPKHDRSSCPRTAPPTWAGRMPPWPFP